MALLNLGLGTMLDQPVISSKPYIFRAYNIRARLGRVETVGLHGPLKDIDGNQLTLPGAARYRKVFTTPSTTTGQILFGANDSVQLVDFDPGSTPATGTRWRQTPVTPAGLAAATDTLPNPSAARVEIPPVWWFADQDDVVVGGRANVAGGPASAWDRNRANDFVPLADSPTGAVGGGILNRILVLLGCTSFTDPDPLRFMTIRWSDRFNFETWTPSDVNLSGELQLEGGSRIVGGGVTGFGVVAWTDRRMALLVETFDPDSVFSRRYIDGGRGLMANNAWCEADGQVFWFDESRTLCIYDGGRPRQIENPVKYATIERLDDRQMARAYLVANPEYGEVILHYPSGSAEDPDRQLAYNYIYDVWNVWRFTRTGWCPRFGVIHNLAINASNQVFQHDLDTALATPWLPSGSGYEVGASGVAAADVTGVDFSIETNLITMEAPTRDAWHSTRIMVDHLPLPAVGASDSFTLTVTTYDEPTITSTSYTDFQTYPAGGPPQDFRAGGKALMLGISGVGVKTVFRFGDIDITSYGDGER